MLAVTGIVAAGLVASGLAIRADVASDRSRDRDLTVRAEAVLDTSTSQTAAALRAASGLLSPAGVEPTGFVSFAEGLVAEPAIAAVAYEPIVPDAQRAQFEASIEGPILERGPDGTLVPAQQRDSYVPISLIAPTSDVDQALVGFDLASDPDRGPAIARALSTGETQMTGPVQLANTGTTGVVVIQPICAPTSGDAPPSCTGLVTTAFEASALRDQVVRQLPANTQLALTDAGEQIFATDPPPSGGAQRSLDVLGRSWMLTVQDPAGPSVGVPALLLVLTILLSGFVVALFSQVFRHQDRLDEANHELTAAEARTAALQRLTSELSGSVDAAQMADAVLASVAPSLRPTKALVVIPRSDASGDPTIRHIGFSDDVEVSAVVRPTDRSGPRALDHAIRTGATLWLPDVDAWGRYADLAPLTHESEAVAVGPFGAADSIDGVLVLWLPAERDFTETERSYLETAGAQLALAIERSQLYEAEHALAATLQRSLLPREMPELPGVRAAARYQPAAEWAYVGGDWFDVFPIDDDRVGVVLGDVVGHGPTASAIMGQVRSALVGFATHGGDPVDVLSDLDAFAATVQGAEGTTVAFGIIDIASRRLSYACAGHPPPVLVGADGTGRLLADGSGTPLGWGFYPDSASRGAGLDLEVGATLFLYSDGAIERRGEDLATGLERFRLAAERVADLPVDECCDRLLTQVAAGSGDDVALLVARLADRTPD